MTSASASPSAAPAIKIAQPTITVNRCAWISAFANTKHTTASTEDPPKINKFNFIFYSPLINYLYTFCTFCNRIQVFI